MKKRLIALFCTLLLVLPLFCGAGLEEAETLPYTVVVPLSYGFISAVDGGLFIALSLDSGTEAIPRYDLFTLDGGRVIQGRRSIEFAGDWIVVGESAEQFGGYQYGLYDRAGWEIIPCVYDRIILTGEDECVAMDGDQYIRPGSWYGELYRYNLASKTEPEALGYGWEGSYWPDFPSFTAEDWKLAAQGAAGVRIESDAGDVNSFASSLRAYNDEGQLLLDFTPYCEPNASFLSASCGGKLLHGYAGAGEVGHNYLFSGRGRLIAKADNNSFEAIGDGGYIVSFAEPSVINSDGETVVPAGVFDSYSFNFTNTGSRTNPLDRDDWVIVSKDGKYGVIQFAPYVPKPSDWARDDVAEALSLGIATEELGFYWKDCVTRLEFCKMLAAAFPALSGETLAQRAEGLEAPAFTDCDDPDVLNAAALGIIQGVGNQQFHPNHFLTREQAAALLARTADLVGVSSSTPAVSFSDEDSFSDWAVTSIASVSGILCGENKNPLMEGTGEGAFSPARYYTVEQAAVTLLRLTKAK